MPHTPKAAPILVYPIDLSPVAADAMEYVRQQGLPYPSASVRPAWAIVPTRAGLYAVCTEGVGGGPIDVDHPLTVEIFGDTYTNDEGQSFMPIMAFATCDLGDGDLIEMMTGEHVPLHEWVRTFGGRLRENYAIWERTLTAALAGEVNDGEDA